MDLGLFIATLVALLLANQCEAGTSDNIFGEANLKTIALGKLKKHLETGAPDVATVARLLFWSEDKEQIAAKKVTVNDLLRLARINPDVPEENCRRERFEEYEAVKKKVAKSASLAKYCLHCMNVQFVRCSQVDADLFYKHMIRNLKFGNDLLYWSHSVTRFIRDEGREGEPEEASVADYLSAMDKNERREFRNGCDEFEKMITEELLFFHKTGPKHDELLERADVEKNWIRKRCAIVRKMVS